MFVLASSSIAYQPLQRVRASIAVTAGGQRVPSAPVAVVELSKLSSSCPPALWDAGPELCLGLISPADVCETAGLLVECFYSVPTEDGVGVGVVGESRAGLERPREGERGGGAGAGAAVAVAVPPTAPQQGRVLQKARTKSLPPRLEGATLALQERWRTASRGLQWRLAERLQRPSVALSMEASLLLALQERRTGQMVGCVEISLREAAAAPSRRPRRRAQNLAPRQSARARTQPAPFGGRARSARHRCVSAVALSLRPLLPP